MAGYGKKKRQSQLYSSIEVLQSLFKKSKTGFSSEYNRVRLEQNWSKIVGVDLEKMTHPRKIYKTTLYITAESSEVRYHLNFSKDIILKKINEFLGDDRKIEHISFKSAPVTDKDKYSDKEKNLIKTIKS